MTNDLAAWSPATDTHELKAVLRGIPLSDLPTVELSVIDLKPPVDPTPHRARFPRARSAWLLGAATVGAVVVHLFAGGVAL